MKVLGGRNITTKVDVFCKCSIEGEVYKTKSSKISSGPTWNHEFTFNLIGVNDQYADVKLKMIKSKLGKTEEIGIVRIAVCDILNSLNKEEWYTLASPKDLNVTVGDVRVSWQVKKDKGL